MKETREELRRICDDGVVLRDVIMDPRVVIGNAVDISVASRQGRKSYLTNGWRDGGREEKSLTFRRGRQICLDTFYVVSKTHVKESVRFI